MQALNDPAVTVVRGGLATLPPVRDIQELRLQNLRFLVQECEAELGRERGAVALLAVKTGVPAPLLSMLLRGKLHSVTGRTRRIGDDTATKLEAGMSKRPGWLDVDRSDARDYKEAALLDKLRLLTPEQREAVARLMDAFTAELPAASPMQGKSDTPTSGG